ncbi:MAG: hypothetical protein ACLTMP_05605 [Eggerthella lenta]
MTAAAGEAQAGIGATIAQGRAAAEESRRWPPRCARRLRRCPKAMRPKSRSSRSPMRSTSVRPTRGERLDALDAANRQAGDLARAVSRRNVLRRIGAGRGRCSGAYADGLFGDTVPPSTEALAQLSAVSSSLAAAVEPTSADRPDRVGDRPVDLHARRRA